MKKKACLPPLPGRSTRSWNERHMYHPLDDQIGLHHDCHVSCGDGEGLSAVSGELRQRANRARRFIKSTGDSSIIITIVTSRDGFSCSNTIHSE